jgi:hypothetical protein
VDYSEIQKQIAKEITNFCINGDKRPGLVVFYAFYREITAFDLKKMAYCNQR